jgi:hypothetical protein
VKNGGYGLTVFYGQTNVWELGEKEGNRIERRLSHIARMQADEAAYKEAQNSFSS